MDWKYSHFFNSFSLNLRQTGNWKWTRHILQNLIQCQPFCLISCWFGNKYIFSLIIIILGFTLCFCTQLDPFGARINRIKRYLARLVSKFFQYFSKSKEKSHCCSKTKDEFLLNIQTLLDANLTGHQITLIANILFWFIFTFVCFEN